MHVDATNSAGQDSSSLPGWSIRDKFQWNNSGDWQDSSGSKAIRIAIQGNFIPLSATAPTAVDGTVTATEDTAYTFTAADFNFSATTGGDTLASVEILTLPALGALTLSSTAVTAEQSVTKDQLDARQPRVHAGRQRERTGLRPLPFQGERQHGIEVRSPTR